MPARQATWPPQLFNEKAGTKIIIVPYQGGSNQAVTDLLSGRITLMFNVAATLAPHVAAGKLKAFRRGAIEAGGNHAECSDAR